MVLLIYVGIVASVVAVWHRFSVHKAILSDLAQRVTKLEVEVWKLKGQQP